MPVSSLVILFALILAREKLFDLPIKILSSLVNLCSTFLFFPLVALVLLFPFLFPPVMTTPCTRLAEAAAAAFDVTIKDSNWLKTSLSDLICDSSCSMSFSKLAACSFKRAMVFVCSKHNVCRTFGQPSKFRSWMGEGKNRKSLVSRSKS